MYGTPSLPHNMMVSTSYLRFKGLTDSNFLPLLPGPLFKRLEKLFKAYMSNDPSATLVKKNASSRKLKTQQKMIAIIKSNLQEYPDDLAQFERTGEVQESD